MPTSGPERLRRFVAAHEIPLAVLGAAVVLLSFVIKDGIEDHIQGRINEIHAASIELNIRQDIMALSNQS